jgi:hypothetical protein
MQYAVETGAPPASPLEAVKWTRPRTLVWGFAPEGCVALIVLAYPKDDPRRRELRGDSGECARNSQAATARGTHRCGGHAPEDWQNPRRASEICTTQPRRDDIGRIIAETSDGWV